MLEGSTVLFRCSLSHVLLSFVSAQPKFRCKPLISLRFDTL